MIWINIVFCVRMAPLWSWSEEVRPRTGKDEAISDDSEDRDRSGGAGRKQFVPFNR